MKKTLRRRKTGRGFRSANTRPARHRRARTTEPAKPEIVVKTTDRRSWIVLAITGFGALILRYMRIVQGHGRRLGII